VRSLVGRPVHLLCLHERLGRADEGRGALELTARGGDGRESAAAATGGEYFPAESAEQLTEVFAQLPTDLVLRREVVEISVVFTAVAVVLIALAILLGQAWRPLPKVRRRTRLAAASARRIYR
jgi:hypothetical protein